MSESKDLLLANEYLRRSKRRWKALALAACSTLVFVVLFGAFVTARQQVRAERERARADAALARAHQARLEAKQAARPVAPGR